MATKKYDPIKIGDQFGKLTVVRQADALIIGRWSYRRWDCACACGGSRICKDGSLKNGDAKTCGNCKPTPLERLYKFIPARPEDACWQWIGATNSQGYGSFSMNRKGLHASRASYILHVGEISQDVCVCHACDNPPCTNPKHLFLGSQRDNMIDMAKKGRGGKTRLYGESHPGAKLKTSEVELIRKERANGRTFQSIADQFKVGQRTIWDIVHGNTWSQSA